MTDLLSNAVVQSPKALVTASAVKSALRRRFVQPEWALLFEVGEATGARHTRWADAVAMSLWPSRGLELHGMEIKVSRYDWRKERQTPEKAETIAAYCDRWWLVTGPNVVDTVDEIPPAWGWMLFDGARLSTVKEPAVTDAKVCDRRFLAALLRRMHKTVEAEFEAEIALRDQRREEKFRERLDIAVKSRSDKATEALKAVHEFEEAFGIQISDPQGWTWAFEAKETGRAVRLVKELRLASDGYGSLADLVSKLRDRVAQAIEALAAVGVPLAAPAQTAVQKPARKQQGTAR